MNWRPLARLSAAALAVVVASHFLAIGQVAAA